MSRRKQQIYKRILFGLTVSLVVIGSMMYVTPTPRALAAGDCSDVYTPLSTFVVNGVNANKTFYTNAMNETGVPWEMLAAIHYRETSFSHSNPSNGNGIFQFSGAAGGPYPAGPVSDDEFYRQLKFMAGRLQSDYVWRGSIPRERRQLQPGETNMIIVKDTLFSYNGRAGVYANQAATFGYSSTVQPYEGSPYVMNRFDCARARMGIITQDYGSMDGIDTRYGAFTVFARLRGEDFWRSMQVPYTAQAIWQGVYTDSTKTTLLGWDATLLPGQNAYAVVVVKNTGNQIWEKNGPNPVHLGTWGPQDRYSQFCHATSAWLNCNRPAAPNETTVAPGEYATFEFNITAPNALRMYDEAFNLVAEGKAWFPTGGQMFHLDVRPPTYTWSEISQYAYTDSTKSSLIGWSANVIPGQKFYVVLKARNTGNVPWEKNGPNPVRLGTWNGRDRVSEFCQSAGWMGCNRVTTPNEASVPPGGTGTFEFWMQTPFRTGIFKEHFNLVAEGQSWMNSVNMYMQVTAQSPNYNWQPNHQGVYTDSTKSTLLGWNATLTPNQTAYVVIRAQNTGNVTWKKNSMTEPQIRLGTWGPQDRTSPVCYQWLMCTRPATINEATVAPGEVATFEFPVRAPSQPGVYGETFNLVADGYTWFPPKGTYIKFTVQ